MKSIGTVNKNDVDKYLAIFNNGLPSLNQKSMNKVDETQLNRKNDLNSSRPKLEGVSLNSPKKELSSPKPDLSSQKKNKSKSS